MGQTQSQEINTFVDNYVNSTSLSEVISRYAQTTNAINNNTQKFYLDLNARDISGNVKVFQTIASIIDMQQLVNRSNTTQLTNDIQQAVSSELESAVKRLTDGLGDLFAIPTNQQIRESVINNMSTYVRNAITVDDVNDLLLSSNNVQEQRVVITARDITGDLTFDQKIQANITAKNVIETTINNILQNTDVQQLANIVKPKIESESESVISKGITSIFQGGILWIILAVIILIIGIVLAIILKIPTIWKIIIIVITLILVAIFGVLATRPLFRI